jgi:hypothetical protein
LRWRTRRSGGHKPTHRRAVGVVRPMKQSTSTARMTDAQLELFCGK